MLESKQPDLPIGYWLKKADSALTASIDGVQQANGLTRLEWQLLNTVHEHGPVEFARIGAVLRPFADTPTLVEAIERLVGREVIESGEGDAPVYRLSKRGELLYDDALRSQKDLRRRALSGVSDEQYVTTVQVLQRIVENLEKEP